MQRRPFFALASSIACALLALGCGEATVSLSTDTGTDDVGADDTDVTDAPADTSAVDTTDDTLTTDAHDTAIIEDTTPVSDVAPDTVAADTTEDEPDVPEPIVCDRTGFSPALERGILLGGTQQYRATTLGRLHDELVVESRSGAGPTGPGTYDLADEDPTDCGLCVYVQTACEGYSGACDRVLRATQGTVDITAIGGGQLTGELHDVALVDTNDGTTWCVDGYALDVPVSAPPTASTPAQVNQSISDFELTNCGTGERVPFTSAMDAKGVWAVLTAGWCSYCSQWVPQVIAREDALDAEGIGTAYLLAQDQNYAPPTLEYCRAYAANYGGDPNRFYIDNDHAQARAHFTVNVGWSIPMNLMVRARDMRFLFSAGYYDTSVDVGLDLLRAP